MTIKVDWLDFTHDNFEPTFEPTTYWPGTLNPVPGRILSYFQNCRINECVKRRPPGHPSQKIFTVYGRASLLAPPGGSLDFLAVVRVHAAPGDRMQAALN